MRFKRTACLTVALALMLTPTVAYGADNSDQPDEAAQLSPEVQRDLAEIPSSELKNMTEDYVAEVLSQGGEILGVAYAPFVPDASAARGDVTTMALPAGCGSTETASLVGRIVYNVLSTSCSTNWDKVVFRQRIVYTNPYNPYDYGTLVDSTATFPNPASFQSRRIQFNCANGNDTLYSMYGRNTAVFGGVPYTAEVADYLYGVPCGK